MTVHLPFWRETEPQRATKRELAVKKFFEEAWGYAFAAHIANFADTSPLKKGALLAAGVATAALNYFSRMLCGSHAERPCQLLGAAGVCLRMHTALHEVGHAAVAHLLFTGARTQIDLDLWSARGVTHAWTAGLRNLGFDLPLQTRLGLFNAGGPLASAAVATSERIFAESVNSDALRLSSRIDFLFHIVYALSAYRTHPGQLGHDFVGIQRRLGLRPATCAALMGTVGLALEVYAYFKSRSKSSSERILVPNSLAFANLLPASAPARR
jgi:hypothetical protein